MDSTTDNPPISANEDDNLRLAAQIASVNLLYAQREVANRIIDPSLPTKVLLDLAEHSYKVSGMAKKNEAKEETGKFVFNIHFSGGKDLRIEKEINPSDENTLDTPELLVEEAANMLVPMVSSFPDCPEFS